MDASLAASPDDLHAENYNELRLFVEAESGGGS
jgi:hypothetical protein